MSTSSESSLWTEEQGWPAPVTAHVRPTRPWWKCHQAIAIAGIGCLIGLIAWRDPQLRFLAAFLGALLANRIYVGAPKFARWLPGASARAHHAAGRWMHAAYLRLHAAGWLQFRLRTLFAVL